MLKSFIETINLNDVGWPALIIVCLGFLYKGILYLKTMIVKNKCINLNETITLLEFELVGTLIIVGVAALPYVFVPKVGIYLGCMLWAILTVAYIIFLVKYIKSNLYGEHKIIVNVFCGIAICCTIVFPVYLILREMYNKELKVVCI